MSLNRKIHDLTQDNLVIRIQHYITAVWEVVMNYGYCLGLMYMDTGSYTTILHNGITSLCLNETQRLETALEWQ